MDQESALESRGFKAFLATQFLGAFNDNAFKLVIFMVAGKLLKDSSAFVTLAGALFTVPFIVFSAYAGFLADRFSKKTVMVWAKSAEIAVMALGGAAIFSGSLAAMLVVLFLMGAQSSFFGPAKYGILPETLADEDLSKGNGQVQLWTFLAIIAGTALAGPLFKFFDGGIHLGETLVGLKGQPHLASLVLVAVAALGTAMSLAITPAPPARSGKRFEPNFLRNVISTLVEVHRTRPLFLCMMGSCYFWFLGALFQMNVFIYAEQVMGVDAIHTGLLLTAVALGVGCGSVLAGRWSGEKVEFGLVPLGALGLGLFPVGLAFSAASYPLTMLLLFLLGASAGLYNIPLHAYIQQKSPADSKGRVLATTNVVNFASMLLASGFLWFLQHVVGINAALVFLVVGGTSFLVIGYIIYLLPDFLLRFLVWFLTHTVYRINVTGREHLPKEGGALLVCNHVSYADAPIIQALTQRFIRFIISRQYYDMKFLNPLCRLMGAIPISPQDGPKTLMANLRQASERLKEGEIVCVFAEGTITRTGNLLPFRRGVETIMEGVDAPIIPVYLDRMWGSLFSFEGGRILNRLPTRIPYPVTIALGPPLPPPATAAQARSAVAELGAEAFAHRGDRHQLLSDRFFRQARKRPFRFCMADSTGRRLGYAQAMIGAMAMSRAVRRRCRDDEMVGLMLPNSVAAAVANVAVTLLGKCPVNLNYTASEEAVGKAVEACRIRCILSSRAFLEKAGVAERPEMVFLEEFRNQVSGLDKAIAFLAFWLAPGWLRRLAFPEDEPRRDPALATVMFSSGSTGDPKGVMLTHANLNANIEGLYQVLHVEPDATVLGILPLFHSFGLTGTLWFPLTTGRGVVFHSNPLDFKMVGELVQQYGAAVLTATPTFLMGYLRRCTPEQFASLRYVVVGAEKLKERLAQAFEKKFGIQPLEGYGCTELSPIVSVNIPNVRGGGVRQVGAKPGTIGHPLPGVAVRIVDPDTREPLPPGEDGLLLVKGPNVMVGYLNNPDKTAEVLQEGWYVTGDIASVDADGFITIKDRLSRFSKIGGEMVPHIRIEEEIHALLGASGEQVCVVTAVPDEKRGERLVVLHKPGIDVAKLCQDLRSGELPNLWVPKKESFFPIDDIPLLGTGKLDLKKIKTMAAEMTNASAP